MWYGCEAGAKSSTLAAMIPLAEASGNCEIRPESTVIRIDTNEQGRASQVVYLDKDGVEQAQKAKAVVLSANGAETSRLLLMSENARNIRTGLPTRAAIVGRNLMFNQHALVCSAYTNTRSMTYKGVQVSRIIHDFYETDETRGFYGGGGIDARPLFSATPILHALMGSDPEVPRWGAEFKDTMAHDFSRTLCFVGSNTSLAMDRNNITLDPESKDAWGRPAIRVTYMDHDDDLAMAAWFEDRCSELHEAAGADKMWRFGVHPNTGGEHLLGTCRMGNDPATSVVDAKHRSHDVPNLFICDGSSMVTSGRGQPTMTIMALAFRASDHIIAAAKAGEI